MSGPRPAQPAPVGPVGTVELAGWVGRLAALVEARDDAERIDQLRALEEIKAACAAAQARVTVAFRASQVAAQEAAGVPARDRGRGIGAQVALARRESAHRGGRLVGLAQALVCEMPHTLAALESGVTSEWRATILARETACLTRDQRVDVDAEVGPHLAGMGDRQVEVAARASAYRADPHAVVERSARAEADRCVSTRPAPDVMCRLSALLPVTAGVGAYAALKQHAETLRAAGDPRTMGQIMADTLVERLTGRAAATPTPLTLDLLISDDTLLAGGGEPGQLIGYGPLPAPLARDLARDPHAHVFLRRLYTRPEDGALVSMDTRARLFPDGLRDFLILRDQYCRTPYCGAPIRHADHVVPHAAGGATSQANGQGLCVTCNLAKQAPGWHAAPAPDGAGTAVTTTTPTGHTYVSAPPPPPGHPPRQRWRTPSRARPRSTTDRASALETHLTRLIADSEARSW